MENIPGVAGTEQNKRGKTKKKKENEIIRENRIRSSPDRTIPIGLSRSNLVLMESNDLSTGPAASGGMLLSRGSGGEREGVRGWVGGGAEGPDSDCRFAERSPAIIEAIVPLHHSR